MIRNITSTRELIPQRLEPLNMALRKKFLTWARRLLPQISLKIFLMSYGTTKTSNIILLSTTCLITTVIISQTCYLIFGRQKPRGSYFEASTAGIELSKRPYLTTNDRLVPALAMSRVRDAIECKFCTIIYYGEEKVNRRLIILMWQPNLNIGILVFHRCCKKEDTFFSYL